MDKKFVVTVAARVDARRIECGLSVNGLASASGIPVTSLRRKLEGHADFGVGELFTVGRILDTTANALIEGVAA